MDSENNFNFEVKQIVAQSRQKNVRLKNNPKAKKPSSEQDSDSRASRRPASNSNLKQSVSKDDISSIMAVTRKLQPPSILMSRLHTTVDEESTQGKPTLQQSSIVTRHNISAVSKNQGLRQSKKELSLKDKLLNHVKSTEALDPLKDAEQRDKTFVASYEHFILRKFEPKGRT